MIGLQQIEVIKQQTDQIRQLQALSEVEVIKAQAKGQADDKKAALGIAQLQEKAREFNVKTNQDDQHHDEDLALDITKVELDNQTDLQGGLN